MSKIKAKVISTEIGKFDVDSITVDVEGEVISICFDKKYNVSQYADKEVSLINDDGIFSVELYVEEHKVNAKK